MMWLGVRYGRFAVPVACAMLVALVAGCDATPGNEAGDNNGPTPEQRAFFDNIKAKCGQAFGGRTVLAPEGDEVFEPARLYFIVEECTDDELRIPFVVGDDASRTWILRLGDDGLSFIHEHLRDDGSEYEGSGFGGHATTDGSATFQSFEDYWATADTPEAEYRVWRLRMDRERDLFVYYLDRGGEPAYRLVFYLGPPSPALPEEHATGR